MDLETVLATLRAHEAELRARGIESLSVFGSVARGEAGPDSDVDLAARLDTEKAPGALDRAGLAITLEELLGVAVDLLRESRFTDERLARAIERDRAVAF